jgi:hypothetical protein
MVSTALPIGDIKQVASLFAKFMSSLDGAESLLVWIAREASHGRKLLPDFSEKQRAEFERHLNVLAPSGKTSKAVFRLNFQAAYEAYVALAKSVDGLVALPPVPPGDPERVNLDYRKALRRIDDSLHPAMMQAHSDTYQNLRVLFEVYGDATKGYASDQKNIAAMSKVTLAVATGAVAMFEGMNELAGLLLVLSSPAAVTEAWSPEARAAAGASVAKTEHSPALRQLAEAAGIHLID